METTAGWHCRLMLVGRLFEVAYFFLFVHHLFWIVAVMLLLNPLSETFWPSPDVNKRKQILPQPSAKARARAEARKLMEKEMVDQKIEKLSAREKEHVK